jgi:AraC-like DNA-binding protein
MPKTSRTRSGKSRPAISNRLLLQRAFFERMGGSQQIAQLFEYLPGTYFFVKDRDSRMMCASRPILLRLGLETEEEIIGTTDYDYFPPQVADGFVGDDQRVIRSGEPLTGRIEVWYNEQRLLDWFVTNKLPVHDRDNRIIGVMGTVQSYEGSRKSLLPYSQISHAVDYIRAHHREKITVEQLAQRTNLSTRQLHRKFRKVFGMSVQEFLAKTRIQTASDALVNGSQSIADIAQEFGFCDQSAFTQQFRKHTGMTPLKFRRRYAT